MGGRHADRIWMGIGAAAAALILALGWFLLISPTNARADGLQEQTQMTETRLIGLRQRLVELQQEKTKLPELQARLQRDRAALPTDPAVPALLRQLQDAAQTVGVDVTGINIGDPALVNGAPDGVYALPITVTVESSSDRLGPFVDQLNQVQPRAVLIESTSLSAVGGEGEDRLSMTLTMKAFVAPATGKAAAN